MLIKNLEENITKKLNQIKANKLLKDQNENLAQRKTSLQEIIGDSVLIQQKLDYLNSQELTIDNNGMSEVIKTSKQQLKDYIDEIEKNIDHVSDKRSMTKLTKSLEKLFDQVKEHLDRVWENKIDSFRPSFNSDLVKMFKGMPHTKPIVDSYESLIRDIDRLREEPDYDAEECIKNLETKYQLVNEQLTQLPLDGLPASVKELLTKLTNNERVLLSDIINQEDSLKWIQENKLMGKFRILCL